jgi:hypothetical protein
MPLPELRSRELPEAAVSIESAQEAPRKNPT